jgi:hypothetical protein
MTNEEYQMTQDQIIIAAPMVEGLDIKGFLEAINKAETLAPFMDPTLFMKASKKLGQIKRIAQGALHFQKAIREVAEEREGARAANVRNS